MIEMQEDVYEGSEIVDTKPIYEVYEAKVEDVGDGTGTFLWPRQQRADGKWFGFDQKILARKRAQYLDRLQFRAQYYNDPNDPNELPISLDKFQYFDRVLLQQSGGDWFYKGKKLNLVAAIDFATSVSKRADYSAIVVIGIDYESNIYVLDIARFKTDRISGYYKELMILLNKWSFRKLRAETSVAQSAIVKELKEMYLRPNGISLKIEDHKPNRYSGSKDERIAAILEPRYENLMVYHARGGNWQILEEELVARRSAHDDVKDALASAIEIAVKPSAPIGRIIPSGENVIFHPRFGGRSF
jgi:phage terminase large subunit-like protein